VRRRSYRARVILVGGDLEPMFDSTVDVADGEITGIGKVPGYPDVVDLGDGVLMPQITNAHVHPLDYFLMGIYSEYYIDDLVGAPHGIKYVELRRRDPESLRTGLRIIFRRMRRFGVGFALPIVEYGSRYSRIVIEEAQASGIVIRPLLEPSRFRVWVNEEEEGDVDEVFEAEVRGFVEDGHWVSLVSPLNYTKAELELASKLVGSSGGWVSTHVSETVDTHEDGDLPRLLETMRHSTTLLVHLTQASSDELRMVSGLPVALCPRSNSALVNKLPPVGEALSLSMRLMLGTDNLALIEPNPWDEARFLYYASGLLGKPISPREVLRMLTTWAWGWGVGFCIVEGQPMRGLVLLPSHNIPPGRIHEYVLLRSSVTDIVALIDGNEVERLNHQL